MCRPERNVGSILYVAAQCTSVTTGQVIYTSMENRCQVPCWEMTTIFHCIGLRATMFHSLSTSDDLQLLSATAAAYSPQKFHDNDHVHGMTNLNNCSALHVFSRVLCVICMMY